MTRINPERPVTPFIPKGVILDMDGLMLDTELLELHLFVEISEKMGWPTPETKLRQTIGMGDMESEAFYKREYGADYPFRDIWNAVIEEEINIGNEKGLPIKKGLFVLLDKLKHLNVPMAVATSTKSKRAQWKLEKGGILERFSIFACGDEVEKGKPAPDIFLLAASRLGIEPEHCVGFEDSPAGLAGLAAAGIPSVFIKDLAEPAPEILAAVWQRCTDLEEAAKLFG